MSLVYCKTAILDINTKKITKEDLERSCSPLCIVKKEDNKVIIIAFINIHVKRIVCESSFLLISPSITFDKKVYIDLTSHEAVEPRSPNKTRGFYGLPGFSGSSGYNLSMYTSSKVNLSTITFISTGTTGGSGQNGSPPGKGGIGGAGGLLIINNEVVTKGKSGQDGQDGIPSDGSTGLNTNGIEIPKSSNFGTDVNLSTYNQVIHLGIMDYDLEKETKICKFFSF